MLQSCPSPNFIAPLDVFSKEADTTPHCFAGVPTRNGPMLIPSIAKTAGLGRFVYLIGYSKRRYVFSGIASGQMSLYNDAIFAVAENHKDDNLWVGTFAELTRLLNGRPGHDKYRIFVHLLAEGEEAKSDIIVDLYQSNKEWHDSSMSRKRAILAI